MQCPNRECGATVDEGARVCPQCGMELKPFVPPGPSEGDNLVTEALVQAPYSGRVRKLANASLILAILSCSLLWAAVHIVRPLPQWAPPFVGRLIPLSFSPFLGVLITALFTALAAIVVGHIAITKGRRVPRTGGVSWRTLFGTLLGYVTVVLISLLALSFFSKGRHNLDMSVCANNLARVHRALREYVNESRGSFYPPLSSQPAVLMFSAEAIPQKDEIGPRLTCPTIRYAKQPTTGPASPFDDQSYFYLGYAVLDEDDVKAFARAYRKQIAEGETFDGDLVVEDGEGTHVLHRLREGLERVLCAEGATPTDEIAETARIQNEIPLLIERDLGHINAGNVEGPNRIRGAWVLYLSGEIRFVERGTWPITEKTQRILAELAE